MNILYLKLLIETELRFEQLTKSEQISFINQLIADHQISYPDNNAKLVLISESDGSLDW